MFFVAFIDKLWYTIVAHEKLNICVSKLLNVHTIVSNNDSYGLIYVHLVRLPYYVFRVQMKNPP